MEKKREKLYQQEVNKSFKQIYERCLNRAKFEQEKYYKEIRQCIENLILSIGTWIGKHIKIIIVFIIIIIIFYFATKDSNDTKINNSSSTSAVQNTQATEKNNSYYSIPNYNSDISISEDDLFNYKQNSENVPGKKIHFQINNI